MQPLILFNKPFNVVCQFKKETDEETLADYIKIPGFYAAGRLDKNSEGLLILTNNGQLQHRISNPKFNKKKYYWVQIEGEPQEKDLLPLKQGLRHQNQYYLPAEVKIIPEPKIWIRTPPIRFRQSIATTWLEIILTEGKNHQIRKMTAAIDFPTLRLIRHRINTWSLEDLQPGEWCYSSAP